ncbi:hypothetical protein HPP92_018694 [Vanilla planifolia]|uniref:Late embryogenesis abundant protein LEA-2 subgroup domain-containing protein n=1 Tax=Vanilla planifolia TaxID=51239 RepID=A0A835QEJ8_VANPL|nr:hypothetical protein HPP92_018694 [Vanilla planifolia]
MASLLFLAQNDNKFGIRYGPANLGLTLEGDPIGIIEVPGFYQPPNGTNVTLITHVMMKRLDISRFVLGKTGCVGEHPCDGKPLEVRIVGMVRAGIHVNNFSFPRLKICIDCKIKLDYFTEIFRKGMLSTKGYKVNILKD